jgi:uncharacterized repeat protein (TIGR01451 family)
MRNLRSLLAFLALVGAPALLCAQGVCQDCSPAVRPAAPPGPLPPPIVTLQVIAPCQAKADGEIPYEIVAENRGQAAAHFVTITNSLPANAKLVRADPPAALVGNEFGWSLGALQPGQRQVIRMVLKATGPGEVENCVRISYQHGVCTKTRVGAVPPGAEEAMPPPTPLKTARLEISGDAPARQATNAPFSVRLGVSNAGEGFARNLRVIAKLPPNLTYESSAPAGTFIAESREVHWRLGDLDPKNQKEIDLRLKGEGTGPAPLRVVAEAEHNVRAERDFSVELYGGVGLHLEIRDKGDPLFVGEDVEYDILVRNTGNAPATRLHLSLAAPAELRLTRPRGPSDIANWREGDPTVTFGPFNLQPGQEAVFRVNAKALRPGFTKFRAQLTGDPLTSGPVLREEPTTIVSDLSASGPITRRLPKPIPAERSVWAFVAGPLLFGR